MSVKVHEAFSIDSFQDRLLWWDDFLGDQLQDEWRLTGAVGSAAVVDLQTGGIVRITTGAVTGNNWRVEWSDIRSLLVSKKVAMEVRTKLNSTTNIDMRLSLFFDGANQIRFLFDTGIANNWRIQCRDGGVGGSLDSGIAGDTSEHIFRIECHTHGSNHAHFYIDGVETASSPITTNIPDDVTDYLQPYFYLETKENNTKSVDIDYVVVRQEI